MGSPSLSTSRSRLWPSTGFALTDPFVPGPEVFPTLWLSKQSPGECFRRRHSPAHLDRGCLDECVTRCLLASSSRRSQICALPLRLFPGWRPPLDALHDEMQDPMKNIGCLGCEVVLQIWPLGSIHGQYRTVCRRVGWAQLGAHNHHPYHRRTVDLNVSDSFYGVGGSGVWAAH